MDGDRLARFGGDGHLRDERRLLGGDIGVVQVVVVETDFADSNAAQVGYKLS